MAKIPKKILLVEDDPDQILIYQTKFLVEGFNLISARNGQEGLAVAETEKPDLIFLDMVMAQMDGMTVLKKLKTSPKTKKIPVVLLSNLIKKELIEKAKKLGAVGFWSKTKVMPQELVNRVKMILK